MRSNLHGVIALGNQMDVSHEVTRRILHAGHCSPTLRRSSNLNDEQSSAQQCQRHHNEQALAHSISLHPRPRRQVPRATLRKASSPWPYRFGDGVLSRLFYEPPLPAKNRQIAKRSEKWEMVAGGWTRRMDKRGSRPRAELATRMSGRDSAALALFAIYALTVASWLVGGLAPVLSASFPTMLATFSEWAEGSGALASLSRRVVQDSTEAPTEQRF